MLWSSSEYLTLVCLMWRYEQVYWCILCKWRETPSCRHCYSAQFFISFSSQLEHHIAHPFTLIFNQSPCSQENSSSSSSLPPPYPTQMQAMAEKEIVETGMPTMHRSELEVTGLFPRIQPLLLWVWFVFGASSYLYEYLLYPCSHSKPKSRVHSDRCNCDSWTYPQSIPQPLNG